MNHAGMLLGATYDARLVVLSYAIAVLASYTFLDVAGRVAASRGRARQVWLASGAFAMGIGIWSMHFTGMLAFRLPVAVAYDVPLVLASVLPAIASSALALFVVGRPQLKLPLLALAGVVMGAGIVLMHYTGIGAMRLAATTGYAPLLFGASVLIAIGAASAAVWIAFTLRNTGASRGRWLKSGAALVMGGAIVGMHYTGMAAVHFTATGAGSGTADHATTVALGIGLALATLLILGLALMSALVDRRFAAQAVALSDAELRYRSLFDRHPDAVYALSPAGHFTSSNPTTAELTGVACAELSGRPVLEFIAPEHRATAGAMFERTLAGEPQHAELAVLHAAGRRVDVSVTSLPIVVSGAVVGVYGIAKDITEPKRAAAALAENEQELRTVVGRQQLLLATIQALATPVLPLHEDILAIPVIGTIDQERGERMLTTILGAVEQYRAKVLLIDLTGVPVVDAVAATHLAHAAAATPLLGAHVMLIGIAPATAQMLAQLDVDLRQMRTCADLASGLRAALGMLGALGQTRPSAA